MSGDGLERGAPALRRLRRLDPPPGNVSVVIRIDAELLGRTDDLVVDRADGRLGLGIHGREGVDDRHPGAFAVVQRVADAGLRQAERPRSRGGIRVHAADSSTSAAELAVDDEHARRGERTPNAPTTAAAQFPFLVVVVFAWPPSVWYGQARRRVSTPPDQ